MFLLKVLQSTLSRYSCGHLQSEIKIIRRGATVYGRESLSYTESEELSFIHSCVVLRRAQVSELLVGLQRLEIQLVLRKLDGILRLQEQRAGKDALRAEARQRSAVREAVSQR